MITSRYRRAAVIAVSLLGGCQPTTRAVREIVASGAPDEELLEQFGQRVTQLARDRDAFGQEMREAGFVPKPMGSSCSVWGYPVQNRQAGKPDRALRAFAIVCGTDQSLEVERTGFAHHPMTYD